MFDIFRAGTRRDNNGREVTISAADVAACAAAYDPAKHEAPIVIGHPKTEDPAYGWIKGLSADAAGNLAAEFGVSAERIRQIEVAAFKKLRVALAGAV